MNIVIAIHSLWGLNGLLYCSMSNWLDSEYQACVLAAGHIDFIAGFLSVWLEGCLYACFKQPQIFPNSDSKSDTDTISSLRRVKGHFFWLFIFLAAKRQQKRCNLNWNVSV